MVGQEIEDGVLTSLVVVIVVLAVWLYLRTLDPSSLANAAWKAITNILESIQKAVNSFVDQSVLRLQEANLGGTNSDSGDIYGTSPGGGPDTVRTGTSIGNMNSVASY